MSSWVSFRGARETMRVRHLLSCLAMVPVLVQSAPAQEPVTQAQEQVEVLFRSLQGRMEALHAALAAADPAQGDLLASASRFAQERQIGQQMARGRTLLGERRYDEAMEILVGVRKSLTELHDLLVRTPTDPPDSRQRTARIGALQRQVQALVEEQVQLRMELEEAGATAAEQELAGFQERQEALERRTGAVASAMEQGADGKASDDPQQQLPGSSDVRQAAQKQAAAADRLGRKDPAAAAAMQLQAEEALRQAVKRLEAARKDAQEQATEQLSRELTNRLAAMLARQVVLADQTVVADRLATQVKARGQPWPAALVERVLEVAGGQTDLVREAAAISRVLVEDDTAALFPDLVAQLGEDLERVRARVTERLVDDATQSLQEDVKAQLQLLLEALQDGDAERSAQQQGEQQSKEQPPLVPATAELRLLARLQERVHARTRAMHGQEPLARTPTGLKDLASQQEHVATLMRKLADRMAAQAAQGGGR